MVIPQFIGERTILGPWQEWRPVLPNRNREIAGSPSHRWVIRSIDHLPHERGRRNIFPWRFVGGVLTNPCGELFSLSRICLVGSLNFI